MNTWQQRHPNERERVNDHILLQPFEDGDNESAAAQVSASSAQSPPRVAVGAPAFAADHPLINLHSHHDFRDVAGDLKRDPGREWETNQQREKIPGVG
jgi:hypothetical protein